MCFSRSRPSHLKWPFEPGRKVNVRRWLIGWLVCSSSFCCLDYFFLEEDFALLFFAPVFALLFFAALFEPPDDFLAAFLVVAIVRRSSFSCLLSRPQDDVVSFFLWPR